MQMDVVRMIDRFELTYCLFSFVFDLDQSPVLPLSEPDRASIGLLLAKFLRGQGCEALLRGLYHKPEGLALSQGKAAGQNGPSRLSWMAFALQPSYAHAL